MVAGRETRTGRVGACMPVADPLAWAGRANHAITTHTIAQGSGGSGVFGVVTGWFCKGGSDPPRGVGSN